MRPLKISMQAFGPYLDTEVVDFEELGERRMFLISGDTGAGKSTILDAMCFALYGESPGDERTATEMRSKNASPKLSTTIEFTFTVGNRRYTVSRSPAQTRPKLKGDGETTVSAKATLVQLDGTDEVALASQPKKVTDEIISLLGFTAVQFRQVVVLPQGQFRKFLASNSDERQKILSDLFRTMRYERVETALKDRGRAVTEKLQAVNAKVEGLLAGSQVESIALLISSISTLKDELKKGEVELQTRQSLLKSALDAFNDAKKLVDLFNQRDALSARIKQIEEAKDEQIEREQQLRDAHRAVQLAADFERREQFQTQHVKVEAALAETTQRQTQNQKSLQNAEENLDKAKQSEPLIAQTLATIERLQTLKASAGDLTEANKKLEEAENNAEEAKQAAASAEAGNQKLETELDALRTELTQLSSNVETAELVEQEGLQIKSLIDNHKRYATLLTELQQLDGKVDSTKKSVKEVADRTADARQNLKRLEDARDQGRATLLAQALDSNAPCPVCGSLDHPAPADSSIDIPGEDDIERARSEIDTLQQRNTEIGQTLGQLTGQRDTQKAEANILHTSLGDNVNTPLSDLENTRQQLAARYREAKTRQQRKTEIDDRLKVLASQTGEQATSLQSLTTKSTMLNEAAATARGARESILTRLPEQYREPDVIDSEIHAETERHEQLKAAAEQARKLHQSANTALAEVAIEVKTHRDSLSQLAANLKEATQSWAAKREAAGFDTDQMWIDARVDETTAAELQTAVEKYKTELDQANGALKEATQACAGQVLPNIAAIEKQHTEASALWDTLNTDVTNKRVRVEQLDATRSQINQALAGQESLDAEYKVVQHLANIATGGAGNPLKLSLHRYVLGVILDEVLIAATHRLLHLSRGRYRLERRLGAGDQRRAGGLELDVFDGDTGESRPVSTLSGGEGFQAALALALGLAEVTQNHAGGIHLETLFVDEGFGSLDQEALQAAISTLIEANRDGRLIGIISHVSELKEHIDTRLDIKKSVSGSSANWVIP